MVGSFKLFETRMIGYGADPLLKRYILFRCPWFGVYVHKLLRSDYQRSLHDHPWPFISVMLHGAYVEVYDNQRDGLSGEIYRHRHFPDIVFRPAKWRHRVLIDTKTALGAWTLVFVGPRQRKWGFWVKGEWCWWRKHNQELNICEDEVVHNEGED